MEQQQQQQQQKALVSNYAEISQTKAGHKKLNSARFRDGRKLFQYQNVSIFLEIFNQYQY